MLAVWQCGDGPSYLSPELLALFRPPLSLPSQSRDQRRRCDHLPSTPVCVIHQPLKQHGSTRFDTVRRGSTRFVTARHGSTRSVTVRHGSSRFVTVRHGSSRLVTVRHGSSRLVTARHGSSRCIKVTGYNYEILLQS